MTPVEKKPNVFIAWAGPRSRLVAQFLKEWLPTIIDAVNPWMSDDNIRSGANWFSEIMAAVESIDVGVLCMTAGNLDAPWIHFEGGALAKRVSNNSRVMPYLIGPDFDVRPPLSAFQRRRALKEPTLELVRDINALTGTTADPKQVEKKFAAFWPELEAKIKEAESVDEGPAAPDARPSPEEMVREVLDLVRGIRADVAGPIPPDLSTRLRKMEADILLARGFAPPGWNDGLPTTDEVLFLNELRRSTAAQAALANATGAQAAATEGQGGRRKSDE